MDQYTLQQQYQCSNISSVLITAWKFEQIFTKRVKPTVFEHFCEIPVQSAEVIFYSSMSSWNILAFLLSVNLNLPPRLLPQASTSSMWGLSDFLSLSFSHGENYYKWSKQNSTIHNYYSLCTGHLLGCGFLEASNDVWIKVLHRLSPLHYRNTLLKYNKEIIECISVMVAVLSSKLLRLNWPFNLHFKGWVCRAWLGGREQAFSPFSPALINKHRADQEIS